MKRNIVLIDEEKCDGCGLCAEACAEGAIRIIDGKARLLSESYCDGLGACIGECPQGAISIEEREAEGFDEAAVKRHLADLSGNDGAGDTPTGGAPEKLACGCPGSAVRELSTPAQTSRGEGGRTPTPSSLRNWPVQLRLVPVNAPFLRGAKLLLAADCVGFAHPDLHSALLDARILLVGCPKLDDASYYREKLAAILEENDVRELAVAYMEVPCCSGLVNLARQALADSGRDIPFTTVKIGIDGGITEGDGVPSGAATR